MCLASGCVRVCECVRCLQSTLFASRSFFFVVKMKTASTGSIFKSHVPCASQSLLWLVNKVHTRRSICVAQTHTLGSCHCFIRAGLRAIASSAGTLCVRTEVHDIHFHSNDAMMISDMHSSRESFSKFSSTSCRIAVNRRCRVATSLSYTMDVQAACHERHEDQQ